MLPRHDAFAFAMRFTLYAAAAVAADAYALMPPIIRRIHAAMMRC